MSLLKAIEHGKEKRKHYRGAKAFDWSCTNHGSCKYCTQGRQHKKTVGDKSCKEAIREYFKG